MRNAKKNTAKNSNMTIAQKIATAHSDTGAAGAYRVLAALRMCEIELTGVTEYDIARVDNLVRDVLVHRVHAPSSLRVRSYCDELRGLPRSKRTATDALVFLLSAVTERTMRASESAKSESAKSESESSGKITIREKRAALRRTVREAIETDPRLGEQLMLDLFKMVDESK